MEKTLQFVTKAGEEKLCSLFKVKDSGYIPRDKYKITVLKQDALIEQLVEALHYENPVHPFFEGVDKNILSGLYVKHFGVSEEKVRKNDVRKRKLVYYLRRWIMRFLVSSRKGGVK